MIYTIIRHVDIKEITKDDKTTTRGKTSTSRGDTFTLEFIFYI